MTWFATFLLAGTLFTSGTGLLVFDGAAAVQRRAVQVPVVLDETERFAQTYPFDPEGKIEISNINGSIVIEAWDSPQISLEAVKIADTKERLSDVVIVIEATQNEFSVRTDYKPWKDRIQVGGKEGKKSSNLSVDFKLKVPRTAILKEIETINGSVELSNLTNYIEVSAVNGAVKAVNLKGTAKLSTVNGTVSADFEDLTGSSTIKLNTVNGTVKLMLPSNTNATVKADSVNGDISNDFGLPVRKGKYVGRDLYGRIGSGEVKVRLNSVNGGIQIARKNDGGTPNPAVDLLPQKTADDFDDSFDSDFKVEVGRINEDFERALGESKAKIEFSEKEIEKAMKALDSVMVDVRPELAISAEAFRKATESLDREKLSRELESERGRIEEELARAAEALYVGRSPFVEEKSGSFEVSGIPTVTVDAADCAVRVNGWDKQEVKYSVTRLKRNETPSEVNVYTFKDEKNVRLEVKTKKVKGVAGAPLLDRVRLEVFVPKKSNLRIVTRGEVRLEGVTGNLELVGATGAVNVRDSNGKLTIGETNGTVRVIGFEGDLVTSAIHGDVYLEGDFRMIDSSKGVGMVFLTLPDDASAVIRTRELVLPDAVAVNEHTWRLGSLSFLLAEEGVWKVGSGKSNFNLQQEEGGVQVRRKSDMFVN
jgi:hypothetical protein